MSILPILIAPDPRLKQIAEPVKAVDHKIQKLMDDMLETMYAEPGIGLAAPQVGKNLRVIVIDILNEEHKRSPLRMANPEITWVSETESRREEGCLSLPENFAEVVRPDSIKVKYLDEYNNDKRIETDGMLATCIQHEIDHLNGVLFVDHVSALKRKMILRKLVKSKKISKNSKV